MGCFDGKELKHLADSLDACDKGIDIRTGVVKGEAGAAGAFDAQPMHQGLGTMMACADGYAEAVEKRAHVEVVDKRPTPILPREGDFILLL